MGHLGSVDVSSSPVAPLKALPKRSLCQWVAACLLCWFSLTVFAEPIEATEVRALEHQIKAAMLYRFLGYTDWPAESFPTSDTPYRIWVLGASSVDRELRHMTSDRRVNDRPVQIFHATSPKQIEQPHLVFVGRYAERFLPRLAGMAREQSFLIVTENEKGLRDGSTINLRLIDGRIGFDVALRQAREHNLHLSARLLSVAATVIQDGS